MIPESLEAVRRAGSWSQAHGMDVFRDASKALQVRLAASGASAEGSPFPECGIRVPPTGELVSQLRKRESRGFGEAGASRPELALQVLWRRDRLITCRMRTFVCSYVTDPI